MNLTHLPAFDAPRRFYRGLLLCCLTCALSDVCLVAQTSAGNTTAARKAFNKSDITDLLKLGAPDTLLIPRVQAAGIDFVATPADLDGFSRLGASQAFLGCIREASEHFVVQKAAEDERILREKEALAWKTVEKRPDRNALQSYLRDFPNGPNTGLAQRRLASWDEAIGRMQRTDASNPRDTKFAHIVAIREGKEDSIIGRLDSGEYFKATTTPRHWERLGLKDSDDIPQDVKDDLNSLPLHPLLWLVNIQSLQVEGYNNRYEDLLNSARLALFGSVSGVIITMYPRGIPIATFESNGKLDPAKFAYLSLNYSALSPVRNTNPTAPSESAPTAIATAKSAGFEYKTTAKTSGTTGSQSIRVGASSYNVPTASTYYFGGQKMRVDSGDTTTIVDCGAQTMTSMNNIKRTYGVMNFSELNARASVESSKPKIDVKETGQRKMVNGSSANEVLVAIEMDTSESVRTRVEVDTWRSSEISGSTELTAFFHGCGGSFPWTASGFPWSMVGAAGNSALQTALADAYARIPSMSGVVVEETVRVMSQPATQSTTARKPKNRGRVVPPPPPPPPIVYSVVSSGFSAEGIADAAFVVPAFYHEADF